jgi:pimeloyl-ACP methyl ester carboxylesterase
MYIFLSVFIISFVGMCGLFWKLAVKSQNPKRIPIDSTPEMSYEDITFNSGSEKICGWFIAKKDNKIHKVNLSNAPLIILVHGWGSNRTRMLRYVNPLYDAGFSILLFDVRSHGESDAVSALTVKTFRDDVTSAIHYAASRPDVNPNQIGILAHSFGGFGSTLAIRDNVNIKALITDSMPAQFKTIMESYLSRYKLPFFPIGYILLKLGLFRAKISRKEMNDFDVIKALEQRQTPVLMIHSVNDDYVPSSELEYIIEHASPPVDYLYVESEGHRHSETDPRFWENVISFLTNNFSHNQLTYESIQKYD